MVNPKRNLALIFVAVLFLSGCAIDHSRESKKIIEKDNGRLVELTVGNSLIVELPANPSTGYIWETASVNTAVLKQDGEMKFKSDTNAIGSPGKLTLHFKAVAPGKAALKLVYRRPWEKKTAPVKTYQVNVAVK